MMMMKQAKNILLGAALMTLTGIIHTKSASATLVPLPELKGHLAAGKAIVMFYADRCPFCRNMKPIFMNLAEKCGDEVTFLMVDRDLYPACKQEYKFATIPQFIYFDNGKEIMRHGSVKEEAMEANITKLLS